jgi:DNA invertase Pin-like site-specific DNA recombinase
MKVGYVRVSRQEPNPQMQRAELEADGCEQIFEEKISSREESRPELERALEYCRAGDVLVVWRLDRLGRSLRACFAELKVEVLLYALGHEKDLRYRPFGRRMGLSTRSPT